MWATPQRSRWTRTACWRPCTLSVPRIGARAAFARASRLAGADWSGDCAWTAAASARAIANIEIDFFIADSLDGMDGNGSFLSKAARAYTTPRQDARAAAAVGRLRCRLVTESIPMRCFKLFFASLLLYFFASFSASGQLPPAKDSLAPAESAQSAAACSATDASSCAQAAAKIVPQVMGPSPMEENLRRLTDEIGGRVSGSPAMDKAVQWAVAAFRAEGVEVHTEEYRLPATWEAERAGLIVEGPFDLPLREAVTADKKLVLLVTPAI